MEPKLIFVYGTLRHGSTHPMANLLKERAFHRGLARTAGLLFDLGPFPGLVPAAGPDDWVQGNLFELRDEMLLVELDRYEDLPTEHTPPGLFERVKSEVVGSDGQAVRAWLYVYGV